MVHSDSSCKVASLADGNGNLLVYAYDSYDRLKQLTYPDTAYETWTYDPKSSN